MQAIIMAAGKGSRLGSLTGGKPKSFAEVHGKKLIEYNLEALNKLGVDEIIIVTGYNSEAFEELTGKMENVKLVYNPFFEFANVIGSFYMGMQYLHDDFLYLHADTICEPSIIAELVEFRDDINLPVDYKTCDEEAMKICSDNGKVTKISKQIDLDIAEGEFIGIASFSKKVLPDLQKAAKDVLKNGGYNEYFEAAIQNLIDGDEYKIGTIHVEDRFWAEVDFIEDYNRAVEQMPNSMYE